MGQASRRKKEARKNYSDLSAHQRSGNKFTPPFLKIPNLESTSWQGERLPQMIWAILIITGLERSRGLGVFRKMADYIFNLPETERFQDVTISGLAGLSEERREGFIRHLTNEHAVKAALSPMLLFPEMPAFSSWQKHLEPGPPEECWNALARGVLATLDHQSQESTDCRWMRTLAIIVSGHLHFPTEDMAAEFVHYPDYGDMRKVRPSIRACEISFELIPSDWPTCFWRDCMTKTPCSSLSWASAPSTSKRDFSVDTIATAWVDLQFHFHQTIKTTAPDPKHETIFGVAFYALALSGEVLRGRNADSIAARLSLRTIVECYITLAYLLKMDAPELWKSYRAYGTGQAKLAFLKLDAAADIPSHIDLQALERLANEDNWIEFVPVDVGHWEKSSLREMSIRANVKDIYDRFYGWTSNFAHGHWAAMRESIFDTCANPLHRIHRVPKVKLGSLPNVTPDMAEMTDLILELVSKSYPGRSFKISKS